MKQIVISLLVICLAHNVDAQTQIRFKELYHYVLPNFVEGTVTKKSGETIKTLLNYNTITEEMIFQQAGTYLALDEIETIDSVNLQGRTFVPAGKVFYEALTHTPVALYIQHKTGFIPPPNNTGFGTTQTSAVSNLTSLIRTGGAYQLELPDDFKLTPKPEYWLRKYGGYISVKNFRDIEEVFPKKARVMQDFVKTNKLSFKNRDDIIKLVLFCN